MIDTRKYIDIRREAVPGRKELRYWKFSKNVCVNTM